MNARGRTLRPAVALAVLAVTTSCGLLPRAAGDAEPRVGRLVREWFGRIEDASRGAPPLRGLLGAPPFEISLVEATIRSPEELRAWLEELHASYPELGYRIDGIRIEALGGGRYRTRFEVERRGVDRAGLPHVARREHVWLVRDAGHGPPVIVGIEEQALLAFPGTGPRIVCF